MKNTKNIGRGIIAVVGIVFLATGLMFMFNPSGALESNLLEATDSVGALSSVRALWGGAIFAIGASVIIGAIKESFDSIRVGAIFVIAIIFARGVGYFVDGSFPEFGMVIAFPIGMFVLLIIGHMLMVRSTDS